jgi:hypothetical protein
MIESFSRKINLDSTIRLPQTKSVNQIVKVKTSKTKEMGSSLIELLLATFLALIVMSSAAQIISKLYDSGLNRRTAATSAIEVAISNDLAWFRQYAELWRLQKGPFIASDLSNNVTNTPTAYTQDTSNEYTPIACNTSGMATNFRVNAASSSTHESPINSPPYPFISNDLPQSINLPAIASNYNLTRKLEPGTEPGTLKITYTLTNSAYAMPLIFTRSISLYLPAAGWC